MSRYIMAFDQGTTSSRCILFTEAGEIVSQASRELPQIFPKPGWVEQDPRAIFSTQIAVAYEALLKIGAKPSEVATVGITNQRETVLVWDRKTGEPIYNAIVWQCRRTAEDTDRLKEAGYEKMIREKTGLLLDPYFSASKAKWILDNVDGARERAQRGELCFGTVDTWLLYSLSGGKIFATDYSNASRTMLFNIQTLDWDDELLKLFDIPREMLPCVQPSASRFGMTSKEVIGTEILIGGVAGDQQSALFGQCCFETGMTKNTYGTGGFLLMNTGDRPIFTDSGLLTTVAWGAEGKVSYALEGSVFVSGAVIQWLRDGLRVIDSAFDSEYMASKVTDAGGVMLVPAFAGLGAPYWDPYARGTIIGITRDTTKYHIIRAALDAMTYQTADVVSLMERVSGMRVPLLRVDGGAAANDLLLSLQADILGRRIERPAVIETTALGAAYLAGLTAGIYESASDIAKKRTALAGFEPKKDDAFRKKAMEKWHRAVERSLLWEK